jgi:proline iminopeptidase
MKKVFKGIGYLLLAGLAMLLVLALWPVSVTVSPPAPSDAWQRWDMTGGYGIAYTTVPASGETRRTPVIYLHGGPGGYIHSSIVATLAPLAADGHDLYFYDQSGTGRSERRARPKDTTFTAALADLDEIITRHIQAERVVLIGHSYGGHLAAQYAARHPERIERLVLSSPGHLEPAEYDAEGRALNASRYPVPPELRFTPVDVDGEAARDMGMTALPVRAIVGLAGATLFNIKLVPDAEVDAALNTMASRFTRHMVCDPARVQPEEGGAGAYMRMGAHWYDGLDDPRPALRELSTPTLVVQGACDHLDYSDTYEYAALIPDARYTFIPAAGHIIHWDQPERFLALIQEFLKP